MLSKTRKTVKEIKFNGSNPSIMMRVAPSWVKNLICTIVAFLYVLTILALKPYLPQNLFNDAQRMYERAEVGGSGNSFAVTGRLFLMLPSWSHDLIVIGVGLACIVLTFRAARTNRGILISLFILIPMLLLGNMVPSKETVVVLMTLVIFAVSKSKASVSALILTIIGFYVFYGGTVRNYYLLILGVWMALIVLPKLPKSGVIGLAIVGFAGLFWLPPEVFDKLQGTRDDVQYYIKYVAPFRNIRTGIGNPFVPDNPWAFIGNYVYAVIFLHFPFFKFFGVKEIILFANILVYGWLVRIGVKAEEKRTELLSKLFAAHIAVLCLFEPDLGSYFRHFSCILVYLLPAFASAESRLLEYVPKTKTPVCFILGKNAGVSKNNPT